MTREHACRTKRPRRAVLAEAPALTYAAQCVKLRAPLNGSSCTLRCVSIVRYRKRTAFPSPASNFPANSRPLSLADRVGGNYYWDTEWLRAIKTTVMTRRVPGIFSLYWIFAIAPKWKIDAVNSDINAALTLTSAGYQFTIKFHKNTPLFSCRR